MSPYRISREDGLDFRSAEYADLYARSAATAFQHPVWLSTIYEVLAPALQAEKLVVTVRDDDGRLVFVLPLVRRRRGLLRILEYADLGVNDYAAPVLDPAAAAGLLADHDLPRQIRAALGRFDLLQIERVADSPGALRSLIAGATAKRHLYSTHLVDLASTAEAWHERLDPAFVRHLERKYKRLRPKGERRLRLVTDVAEVDDLMQGMRAFRAARFSERRGVDLMQQPEYYDFYLQVARRSIEDGPGRLSVLQVGDEAAAIAFDLVERDRDLYLLVGYDVERLRNYSLGLLIVDELVTDAISRGQAHFDLTVGDEDYKADFGAHMRPLFEIRVPRTVRGRAGVLARASYLQARRQAKRALTAWEQRRRQG